MTSTTPSSSTSSSSPSQSEDEYASAEEKTELLYGAENAVARRMTVYAKRESKYGSFRGEEWSLHHNGI